MTERLLVIDDEPHILAAIERVFVDHDLSVLTASDPRYGLELLSRGDVAVVITDNMMPGISGLEVLRCAKEVSPDTVRIMLTGHADLDTAVSAVNKGAIFRLLTKPCAPDALLAAVNDGLRQYRLVMAERQLLHGTLRGCIQVLSELLAQVSPKAFGRAEKAKSLMTDMATVLKLDCVWKYELAAMLSLVGCISLPHDILERKLGGQDLSAEEQKIFLMHPIIAGNLLRNIPRLEGVIEIVAEHETPLASNPCVGARMLKAALDFSDFEASGLSAEDALQRMRKMPNSYDGGVVSALGEVVERRSYSEIVRLDLHELREGMLLMEPVMSEKGVVLLDKGQTISHSMLERFRNFGAILGVKEPIYVLVRKESD